MAPPVQINDVEEHLTERFAATGPGGPEVPGSEIRAALTALGDLEIDCAPFEVTEDAFAIEINPMNEAPGEPVEFGVLAVRRLFLPDPEDGSSSAAEVGFEFIVPASAGIAYAPAVDHWEDLADAPDEAAREALRDKIVSTFDASPVARALSGVTVEPEALLQDHNEILG
jgi:hypothetical protein